MGSRRRPCGGADPVAARRPAGRRGRSRAPTVARRAGPAPARRTRVPLIRDETGTVDRRGRVLAAARRARRTIHGEAVVDDTVLFDGEVTGVRIEPTPTMPGLRASVLSRRHAAADAGSTGRAAQLGTDGRAGGPRRRAGTAAGPPVDVLSPHPGLAAGSVSVVSTVNIRPLHQSVRPSPIFLAIVALTAAGGVLAWLSARRRSEPLAYVGVFIFVIAGWLVSLCLHEFAPRLHRVALRRPRRRGARLSDAEPAEVLPPAAVARAARAVHRAAAASACPAARCTCARRG